MTTNQKYMGAGYSKVDICKSPKIYIRNIYYKGKYIGTRTTYYDKDGYVIKIVDDWSDNKC